MSETGTEDSGDIGNGIVTEQTSHSVEEVVRLIEDSLHRKGIKLFAVIDHSGEAAKVGLAMRASKLLIFGSPAVGTPVMLACPSSALDLPLKILVAEGDGGVVSVSYNTAEHLQARHGIPHSLAKSLNAARVLVEELI